MNKIAEAITNPALGDTLNSQSGNSFLQSLLPAVIGLLFVIGAVVFLFIFIIGAISWMTAGGDKAKVEAARGRLSSAIIGLILLLISYAIIGLIENFFGVKILELNILGLSI